MKDEEMAEEYLQSIEGDDCVIITDREERKQAFIDGYHECEKEHEWHDLRKDPNDLPKDKHNVWCKFLDQYGEGWYDKDTNTWTLIYRDYHVHCIEAWCELPIFDKENE